MERLRSIEVSITVDTNKQTTIDLLKPFEDESVEEFAERVKEALMESVPQ